MFSVQDMVHRHTGEDRYLICHSYGAVAICHSEGALATEESQKRRFQFQNDRGIGKG